MTMAGTTKKKSSEGYPRPCYLEEIHLVENFWLLKIEKLLETAPPNSKVPFGPDQKVLIGSFVDSALAAVAKRNVHQGQRGMWRSVRARRNYGALENRKTAMQRRLVPVFLGLWRCAVLATLQDV